VQTIRAIFQFKSSEAPHDCTKMLEQLRQERRLMLDLLATLAPLRQKLHVRIVGATADGPSLVRSVPSTRQPGGF
jgi:hypothetical protein